MAMHSSIEKMLMASRRLPDDLGALFDALFQKNMTPEQICIQHGLTMEELATRQSQMMRTLRAAAQ